MGKSVKTYLSLSVCIVLYFISQDDALCYARDSSHFSQKVPQNLAGNSAISIFNVVDYGARGNESVYDTEAFQAAWTATCKVNGGTMLVPSGYTFLLQPIIFNGDKCQPNIVFQVDGKIVAPSDKLGWKKGDSQWISFRGLDKGLSIRGNGGVFDGRGEVWWDPKFQDESESFGDYGLDFKLVAPHALSISDSFNVTVTGITIQNSPRMHIFIENSQQVNVFNFTVSSPGNSKNTDGIHLSRCQHVDIHNSTVACGDDCVSIQSGCSDVKVYEVNCGPGHGYSIGSLGYDESEAHVSNITIRDSTVQDSLTGVRIKTWQGGSGLLRNVTFSNIVVMDVKTPVTIDQFYCGGAKDCKDEPSAVSITGITYENITGTYIDTPVSLLCSEHEPCKNLTIAGLELKPSKYKESGTDEPHCSHAYGQVLSKTTPSLEDCLLSGEVEWPAGQPTKPPKGPSPSILSVQHLPERNKEREDKERNILNDFFKLL